MNQALSILAERLLGDDEDAAEKASSTLIRLGPPARGFFLEWLRSPETVRREWACHILGEVQDRPRPPRTRGWKIDPTPVPALIRVLERDPDEDVRWAAARALQFQRHPAALPAMLRVAREREPAMRRAVAMYLACFDPEDPRHRKWQAETQETLRRLLLDSVSDVRDWAAHTASLDAFQTPAIDDALLELTRDPDPDVRGEALAALAHHGDRRAIPAIRAALLGDGTTCWMWLFEGIQVLEAVELIPELRRYGSDDALAALAALERLATSRATASS